MRKCEFSETQFSFCFTFEYIKQFLPLIPLPIFPNTVEEGRPGGGYDVAISGSVFFQFKIPTYQDVVSRRYKCYWDVFGKEYLKVKIDTNSEQFNLLKQIQASDIRNKVYYAMPEFYTSKELGSYYVSDHIVANSALFSVDTLPAFNSGYHSVIYDSVHTWGRLFSEPMEIAKSRLLHPLETFPVSQQRFTIHDQAAQLKQLLVDGGFVRRSDLVIDVDAQSVKVIYATLLAEFDIHWYPVIQPLS